MLLNKIGVHKVTNFNTNKNIRLKLKSTDRLLSKNNKYLIKIGLLTQNSYYPLAYAPNSSLSGITIMVTLNYISVWTYPR